MAFGDSQACGGQEHLHDSDLDEADVEGNLGVRREPNMVRMFKRLLRGGGRQRVTGVWIL